MVDRTQHSPRAELADVVYGFDVGGDELWFMEQETAIWFAAFQRACSLARTFQEFRTTAPDGAWDSLIRQYENLGDDSVSVPDPDAAFDASDVPGASEGD